MFKAAEYLITLGDVVRFFQRVLTQTTRRDYLAALVIIAVATTLWLTSWAYAETSIFVGILLAALWWRVDGRWPIGIALAGLVVTATLLTLYNHNLLWWGELAAEKVAVWVYFLLVIGVIRQGIELKWPRANHKQL